MLELGIFTAKAVVILFFILAILILIAVLIAKTQQKTELEVEALHSKFFDAELFLKQQLFSKEELKEEKKKTKEKLKNWNEPKKDQKKVFVIDFEGDIKASHVESLREEISAILLVATSNDEIVVRLESPGGMVHTYGLAASELSRIREKGFNLTICVDKIAASGGYLMASVAQKIIAAPFAIIGSIGVVAQVPNLNKLLKKYDVDYKEYTAGEFKRTVSFLGEITAQGEKKFVEQLEETHSLFKSFVQKFRPQLNMSQVATGEYWYGETAKTLSLIDQIQTSDDYLLEKFKENHPIYQITYHQKESLTDKISNILGKAFHKGASSIVEDMEKRNYF